MLRRIDDDFDDWITSELPRVFSQMGGQSIDVLAPFAEDGRNGIYSRGAACVKCRWNGRLPPSSIGPKRGALGCDLLPLLIDQFKIPRDTCPGTDVGKWCTSTTSPSVVRRQPGLPTPWACAPVPTPCCRNCAELLQFTAMQPGDPLDPASTMGATTIVDAAQIDRVLSFVQAGKDEGMGLRLGGEQVRRDSGGFYLQPTIFECPSQLYGRRRDRAIWPCQAVRFRARQVLAWTGQVHRPEDDLNQPHLVQWGPASAASQLDSFLRGNMF